jgi:hypothetical protein
VQTFLLKNAMPGQALAFTLSGEGQIPRQAQGDAGGGQSTAANGQPGGGIGEPIDTPDPLSKYKWWILGALALLLATAAAFLLRRPALAVAGAPASAGAAPFAAQAMASNAAPVAPAAKNAALLSALKEELFALESEKIAGTLSADDYAEQKAALEVVLKRALKRQ